MINYTMFVFSFSLPSAFGVTLSVLIGLCMGSFSSVVLTRTEPDSVIGGRSRCPYCSKILGMLELIPLLSFLIQHGRCLGCKKRIALQYPLLELFGACAFCLGWFFTDALFPALALGLILWAMGVIVISDICTQSISDVLTAFLAIGALVLHFDALVPALLAASVGLIFLGGQWAVSRGRWVGSGDVLLVTALGLFVGRWEYMCIALAIAYIAGAILAAGLLLAKGSAARHMHIPFGPFLIGGALLAYIAAMMA